MIKPTKYSHPDRTTISLALLILIYIRKKRIVSYSNLLQFSKNKVKGGGVLFLPALNFLYILDLIEYHSKTDSIEYIGKYETI